MPDIKGKDIYEDQEVYKIGGNVSDRHSDLLDYSVELEKFKRIFEKITNSFVISLEAPWGTGKSTFLDILENELDKKTIIRINAWEEDYKDDPVTTIIFDLGDKIEEIQGKKTSKNLKKIGVKLSKDLIPSIFSVLNSLLPIPFIGKLLDGAVKSLVDQLDDKEESLQELKSIISEAIDKIPENQIIIFVDELDRCKPSYAVKFLETIKHFFSINGLVFLLAIEDKVLMKSFEKVYGEGFDGSNYLKRFIDLRLELKPRITHELIKNSFKEFNLDFIVSTYNNLIINIEVYYDLVYIFGKFMKLNARDINQISTKFTMSLMLTNIKDKNLLLTLFLITLKQGDRKLYDNYLSPSVSPEEFYESIKGVFNVEFPDSFGGEWKFNNLRVIYENILPAKARVHSNSKPIITPLESMHDKLQRRRSKLPKNQEVLLLSLGNILTNWNTRNENELHNSLAMITATSEIEKTDDG